MLRIMFLIASILIVHNTYACKLPKTTADFTVTHQASSYPLRPNFEIVNLTRGKKVTKRHRTSCSWLITQGWVSFRLQSKPKNEQGYIFEVVGGKLGNNALFSKKPVKLSSFGKRKGIFEFRWTDYPNHYRQQIYAKIKITAISLSGKKSKPQYIYIRPKRSNSEVHQVHHTHDKRVHAHSLPRAGLRHKHGSLGYGKSIRKNKIIKGSNNNRSILHSHSERIHTHVLPKKGIGHSHGSLGFGKIVAKKGIKDNNLKVTSNMPEGLFRTGSIEELGFYDVIKIKGNKITYYSRRSKKGKFPSTTYLLEKTEIHKLEQIIRSTGAQNWKPFYNNHPDIKVGHKWSLQYKSNTLNIRSSGFHQPPPGYTKLFTYVFDALTRNKEPVKVKYAIDGYFGTGGMGGYHSIMIQNKKLTYTTRRRGLKAKSKIYYLTNIDIYHLEKFLIEKGTKSWRKYYNCHPRLMDGTSWSLKYKSKRLNIKSGGHNCYPNKQHYKEVSDYLLKSIMEGKQFRLKSRT